MSVEISIRRVQTWKYLEKKHWRPWRKCTQVSMERAVLLPPDALNHPKFIPKALQPWDYNDMLIDRNPTPLSDEFT